MNQLLSLHIRRTGETMLVTSESVTHSVSVQSTTSHHRLLIRNDPEEQHANRRELILTALVLLDSN